ncbi:annexin B10-like [Daphnia pulex]|uniref:annexin B10-like n=1 Tax=Daphnia pulex TaxID=6669 RepID=UPI001EDD2BBE|nr:annexin B10-like [Daphnia pulex]
MTLWCGDYGEYVKEFPTVHPITLFDPLSDAKALRIAMKGFGTDEQSIINILCKRSNAQRLAIAEMYHKEFGRDLIADLKSELSGDFEDLIVGLMMPKDKYLAKHLRKAIKGIGTSDDVLVEILCAYSYDGLMKIAATYKSMYGKSLDDDIKEDTSGSFRRFLLNTLKKCTDSVMDGGENTYHSAKAQEEARILFKAGEGQIGTDENAFVDILGFAAQRRRQTSAIFQEYTKISGKTIEQAITSEMSGEIYNGLLDMVKIIRNRPAFFAERLELAMKGLGTNDDALIRIIVSRCEIDLVNTKVEYERIYHKTLHSSVESETSGDYKRALLALIGPPSFSSEVATPLFYL